MLTPERALGRGASWAMPDPQTIPQIQIGDAIYQGTAVLARSYRNMAGQHITRITLKDAILISDGSDDQ